MFSSTLAASRQQRRRYGTRKFGNGAESSKIFAENKGFVES